jgi:hypothetical protein
MPGYLIPADLDRMIPAGEDPLKWAETNLLASPGATVARLNPVTGAPSFFRVPTLVVAEKQDHSCIHLSEQGECKIHAIAPFGCAFFDCQNSGVELSSKGIRSVMVDWQKPKSLYRDLWNHLHGLGRVSDTPAVKIQRMKAACSLEHRASRKKR